MLESIEAKLLSDDELERMHERLSPLGTHPITDMLLAHIKALNEKIDEFIGGEADVA